MDARHLRAFITTVDVGSFTRAAARLGVTQPTITNRIKTLEQSLGKVLLERLPGGVRPTRSGRAIMPYARQIIRLADDLRQAASAPGEPRGRVNVGSPESLTNHRLLPLIEYLYVRYPNIDFSMHSSDSTAAVMDVRNGQLDCAFIIGVEQSYDDLEIRILRPEPLALVAAPGRDPAAGGPATVLVCSDLDSVYGTGILATDVAASYRRTLKLNSIEASKRSAANGIGVALLPEVTVTQELAEGTLCKVDWQPTAQTFMQAVWRRSTVLDPALEMVLTAAEKVIREG